MINLALPNSILISILNTKLRNDYDSLESLCDDLDVNQDDIIGKLAKDAYIYDDALNQFKQK
jgi:hypothetical protein